MTCRVILFIIAAWVQTIWHVPYMTTSWHNFMNPHFMFEWTWRWHFSGKPHNLIDKVPPFLSNLLPNCWYLSTKLHSITLHRTVILLFMLPLTGMLMILSYHCVIVLDAWIIHYLLQKFSQLEKEQTSWRFLNGWVISKFIKFPRSLAKY